MLKKYVLKKETDCNNIKKQEDVNILCYNKLSKLLDIIKSILLASGCFLLAMAIVGVFFTSEERQIYDGFIRVHILANSDETQDQQLKLCVRDKITEKIKEYGEFENVSDAEKFFNDNLEELRSVAVEAVKENGYDYMVEVKLGKEYYPTRVYEDFSLPAGEYTSLRVMIGKAEGQNWWCVLYPPLCLSSSRTQDTLVEAGFTPNQVSVITENDKPKYKVKFRIVEWLSEIKRTLFG